MTNHKKALIVSILIHACIIISLTLFYNPFKNNKWMIKFAPGFQSFAFQLKNFKVSNPNNEDNNKDALLKNTKLKTYNITYKNSKYKGVQSELKNGIKNPEPHYPSIAVKWGWEGTVRLRIKILKNGKVGNINIIKPSGYPILDKAACNTALKWQFPTQNKTIYQDIDIEFKIKK